jgi:hypothetical protein
MPTYPTDEEWEHYLPPAYRATTLRDGTRSLVEVLAERRGILVGEVPAFSQENFETEKTQYSIYLVPQSPRLRYAVELTRKLLFRIQDLCDANGATFVVLYTAERWTLPSIPAAPTLFEVNGKGLTLSSASARELIDDVLDGLPTIRVEEFPAHVTVSRTDSHLNGRGTSM